MKRRYDIYRRREPILPIVVTTVGLTLAACAVALILLAMAGVPLRFLFFYLGVLFAAIVLGVIAGATHHPNILTFSIVLALGAFALAGRAYDVHISRKETNR